MTVQVRRRICVQSHPSACAVNIVLTGVTAECSHSDGSNDQVTGEVENIWSDGRLNS